jgi:hypothetical protein
MFANRWTQWYNLDMSPFENVVDAIHGLSNEEKFKLRLLLDQELKSSTAPAPPAVNGARPNSELIGLFADEPELMDRVMESVYEQRARPLRIDG